MSLESRIQLCSENYTKWKSLALSAPERTSEKKYLERAFFWMELQAAFTVLWAIEQTKGKDEETRKKLIVAKANLSKKLADYAKEILKDLQFTTTFGSPKSKYPNKNEW